MRPPVLLTLAALIALAPASADPIAGELPKGWPHDPYTTKPKEWPDGPNKEFLKNLQRPDNEKHPERALGDGKSLSCCDVGDTVKTKFKVEQDDGPHPEDRWYAWINGER
jgi:hypothetical protein